MSNLIRRVPPVGAAVLAATLWLTGAGGAGAAAGADPGLTPVVTTEAPAPADPPGFTRASRGPGAPTQGIPIANGWVAAATATLGGLTAWRWKSRRTRRD